MPVHAQPSSNPYLHTRNKTSLAIGCVTDSMPVCMTPSSYHMLPSKVLYCKRLVSTLDTLIR
jgi:hypothetical protein